MNSFALFLDKETNNPPDVCASAAINFSISVIESEKLVNCIACDRFLFDPPGTIPLLASSLTPGKNIKSL